MTKKRGKTKALPLLAAVPGAALFLGAIQAVAETDKRIADSQTGAAPILIQDKSLAPGEKIFPGAQCRPSAKTGNRLS